MKMAKTCIECAPEVEVSMPGTIAALEARLAEAQETNRILTARYDELAKERDDTAIMLHNRTIAGSSASWQSIEFVWVDGRFAGTAYCTGERWIAFGRHGMFIAAGLTLDEAIERCRDDERTARCSDEDCRAPLRDGKTKVGCRAEQNEVPPMFHTPPDPPEVNR